MRTAGSFSVALLVVACSSPTPAPRQTAVAVAAPTAEVGTWGPASDWASMTAHRFELWLEAEFPAGTSVRPSPGALQDLAEAMARQDERAVRAAAILGRTESREAAECLLGRLEARALGPARESDAGDVVAAAALLRLPAPTDLAPRLVALAVGADAHPDLEVRVECACGALALGRDEPIPFLLQVLRIDTWLGREDERDFTTSTTTAWARDRAARALSTRAGMPLRYHPDAPIPQREREAERLARALDEAR